jgi:hypothetical protein
VVVVGVVVETAGEVVEVAGALTAGAVVIDLGVLVRVVVTAGVVVAV